MTVGRSADLDTYGADDRSLFEKEATSLYEEAVSNGGLPLADERISEGGVFHDAFQLLTRLNLLVHDRETDCWIAEDPSGVQSRVVNPLSQQGAKLLSESSEWARAFAGLGQAWRRSPQSAGRGPFTYVHSEAIDPYIASLLDECEEEVLTAQPQTGRDPRKLALAVLRDTTALERGVRIRTLYQHSARRNAVTHKYVAAVTARGAEVRTLDEFFNRMIVLDQRIAIIPGPSSLASAVAIREPAIVAYLVDVFERSWERGRQFSNKDTSLMKDIAAEQRAMTMRMLIEGHPDPVSAKRLGVSQRTYAGYVADLKDEYEAQTRFQLGYTMGKLGVSGTEDGDEGEGADEAS